MTAHKGTNFSELEQPVPQQASVCLELPVKGRSGYVTIGALKAEQDPRLNSYGAISFILSQFQLN